MLNINYGHNSGLTAGCRRLEEYSRFVACIKAYRQGGSSVSQAIEDAVTYCIDHGIMEDILLPFRAEVTKMLLTEYNEKKYMRLFRKEAREEGLREGREEGRDHLINTMLQNGASPELLSELTGLSLSEISDISQNKKGQFGFPQEAKGTEKEYR